MDCYNFSDALSSFTVEPPTTEQTSSASPRRRPRKGHKKSRRGCFNCKRRKIKCQETYPSCSNCLKSRTKCEYPTEPLQKGALISTQNARMEFRNTIPLQTTPMQFSLTDMRLFHHFLTVACPPVPFGNDQIWTSDIAALAPSYDYLVHSVLGMAASHLNTTSTSDLHADALFHRVHAMRGLNKALSSPPKTAADSDAILATFYALACQSSYISESIEEYLTMFHGCHLVETQGWAANLGTVFILNTPESQQEIVGSRLESDIFWDPTKMEPAKASLEKLGSLCKTRLEKSILRIFHNLIDSKSPRESCQMFRTCRFLAALPHEDFQILVDTTNTNMQLLLAHTIGLRAILYPIRRAAKDRRAFGYSFPLGKIYANMEDNMRGYLEWPMKVTGCCVGIKNYAEKANCLTGPKTRQFGTRAGVTSQGTPPQLDSRLSADLAKSVHQS